MTPANSTPADAHRSKPGYVYGVGMHSKGERRIGEPPCKCPCHVATRPDGSSSWYCDKCYSMIVNSAFRGAGEAEPDCGYSHEQAVAEGRANPQPWLEAVYDYYFITSGNSLSDGMHMHFGSEQEATAKANELNKADVLASLNIKPEFLERRKRLQALGETFLVAYGEARWELEPGRYAVMEFSDNYSDYFWGTVETLDEVTAAIKEGDVARVVDLDSGNDVPFTVSVSFP